MDNPNQRTWLSSRKQVGWVELRDCQIDVWQQLGFRCGLEVHQQLKTVKKLFCRCPAGIYHDFADYDAEIVRHMRPTLSELGEYDGTALMEFKTRKKIVYRINNDSACTYEVDDTPPFPLNREALNQALKIALMLRMNIVGELHITRKQYLDGSIPTGFQRTTILGIEGSFPITGKEINVIQFSVEEDSCREVSDHRHTRVYYADRLGMPLIETVTYPEMLTPWEAREAAQNIRFIARSSGVVRTGIGAARQDVNVSITGGTRVEIKGVAHIRWIPKLTHNEAFRQRSLLLIRDLLLSRIAKPEKWSIKHRILEPNALPLHPALKHAVDQGYKLIAVALPHFADLLCFFNQPGRCFADEIADRLKVIACLEKPNMFHSEELIPEIADGVWRHIATLLDSDERTAHILFWAPDEDVKTALETIAERCQLAMTGVPNETRKSMPDGTTIFERVLPGADRMYPDTDSAPIPILDPMVEQASRNLPPELAERFVLLGEWKVPADAYTYILRNDLMPVLERMSRESGIPPRKLALLYAHYLKSMQGAGPLPYDHQRITDLLRFVSNRKLCFDVLPPMLKVLFHNPNMQFASVLSLIGYKQNRDEDILAQIPLLITMWNKARTGGKKRRDAQKNWMMGLLRPLALGNIPLDDLSRAVDEALTRGGEHA